MYKSLTYRSVIYRFDVVSTNACWLIGARFFGSAALLLQGWQGEVRSCATLVGMVLAGPVLFSFDTLAIWSVTGRLGITHSFPWMEGPLANWTVWLALAALLTVATKGLRKQKADQGQSA